MSDMIRGNYLGAVNPQEALKHLQAHADPEIITASPAELLGDINSGMRQWRRTNPCPVCTQVPIAQGLVGLAHPQHPQIAAPGQQFLGQVNSRVFGQIPGLEQRLRDIHPEIAGSHAIAGDCPSCGNQGIGEKGFLQHDEAARNIRKFGLEPISAKTLASFENGSVPGMGALSVLGHGSVYGHPAKVGERLGHQILAYNLRRANVLKIGGRS